MGPRARRRLAAVGAFALAIALIVAGLTVFGPSRHKPVVPHLEGTPASIRYQAHRLQLTYGMTHHQVRDLVGPPVKVVGNCWQYPKYVIVAPNLKTYVTADRLCFDYGRYATEEFWTNGKWGEPPTRITLPGS